MSRAGPLGWCCSCGEIKFIEGERERFIASWMWTQSGSRRTCRFRRFIQLLRIDPSHELLARKTWV